MATTDLHVWVSFFASTISTSCRSFGTCGPRPERRFYIEQIMAKDARYEQLYALRPGVTSYATLYNGYADSIEKMLKRLELDLYYLQNRSWWMDTRILACTFFKIAGGKKF